ncbi:MAG TPA: LPS-assembly protein LptD, partial [Alphaproteobacteria bacterium]|nr:LPS-assembly protein LptD [Alphaproteobacteria bacterium]
MNGFRTVFASLLVIGIVLLLPFSGAMAKGTKEKPAADVVLGLSANKVTYDRELGIITARGKVEISQQGRTLLSDTISYNQNKNVLTASGNIVLMEPTGEVIFADYMELTGDMKDGVIKDLRMVLTDSSRIAANGARRSGGNILDLRKAVYSPCLPCKKDPSMTPLWQIKAVRIIHDKKRRRIEYRDAWLEIKGIPVAYTPYLSQPDPTVKRESGFLVPSFGNSSDLGVVLKTPYFINISPNRDATLTPILTTGGGVGIAGEYRQRFMSGELESFASIALDKNNDVRGHIKTKGRFNINDTWRTGFDISRASDDTYLRRYRFSSPANLTTNLFTEGFRKRNYFSANAYAFQGLKENDNPGQSPYVLPLINFNHIGEPDRLGGRTSMDLNFMALTRNKGTDTRRLSLAGGWKRPFTDGKGSLYTFSASLRGDLYHVNGLARGAGKTKYNGFSGRVRPEMALDWRYPLVREEGNVYQLFEPLASFIVTPYGGNSSKIPNEDSQEFELDDTNLFSVNRFTGLDRVDSGPRVSYGVKWGLFGEGGGYTTAFLGQSYRLRKDSTFAVGSGLEGNLSDIVGKVVIAPN